MQMGDKDCKDSLGLWITWKRGVVGSMELSPWLSQSSVASLTGSASLLFIQTYFYLDVSYFTCVSPNYVD